MPTLVSDVQVHEIPLRDNGEPLVPLPFAPAALADHAIYGPAEAEVAVG